MCSPGQSGTHWERNSPSNNFVRCENPMAAQKIRELIEANKPEELKALLSDEDIDLDEIRFDHGQLPLHLSTELGSLVF
jgi:hypothetical protein